MNKKMRLLLVPAFFVLFGFNTYSQEIAPNSVLWYTHPADKWENALPVGNGRLGAMVFGRTGEEKIQFNEETYWSGGPYNQTRKGGAEVLPEIQKLIFAGKYIKAHKLFGRFMMGYPVEQMKYQSFGELILKFPEKGEVKEYFHSLDLDKAVVVTSYRQNGIKYKREVFVSPGDEVIVVRITADRPGSISFVANLRGYRSPDSFLPTDERLVKFTGENDPALAALCLQFGRYLLISSSRAGTQPANLQGIWNQGSLALYP